MDFSAAELKKIEARMKQVGDGMAGANIIDWCDGETEYMRLARKRSALMKQGKKIERRKCRVRRTVRQMIDRDALYTVGDLAGIVRTAIAVDRIYYPQSWC